MSDTSLSEAIQEAYASAPDDEVILFTIELNHKNFAQPLRVVRDWNRLTATLEDSAPYNPGQEVEFLPYAFDLSLPEIDTDGKPELTITIDNIGRELMVYLEQAVQSYEKIEVIYRLYLASDLSCPQNDPPMKMTINSVECTPKSIVARASFVDLTKKPFPKKTYTLEQFPSLQNAS